MNTGIEERNNEFDRDMRELHAEAVSQISPQTLARLRSVRQQAQTAPRRAHAWRWIAASAFSAVLAVALGVQFLPQSATSPGAAPALATADSQDDYDDALATLDENPDLYVWLASSEAEPLAME
jgi:anti-sigma-K factor RskA